MNLQKAKPWRSERYKKWVRSLPCVITGRTDNNHAHHIISCGMGGSMAGKPSDLFVIPIDGEEHYRFHATSRHDIDQKAEALRTIEKAIKAGVLVMGKPEPFNEWREGLGDE